MKPKFKCETCGKTDPFKCDHVFKEFDPSTGGWNIYAIE